MTGWNYDLSEAPPLEEVLVSDGYLVFTAIRYSNGVFERVETEEVLEDLIAWQPLPEPAKPKGDASENHIKNPRKLGPTEGRVS